MATDGNIILIMKIAITVKAGSKKGSLVQVEQTGALTVYIREPAQDGKANIAVIQLLSEHYGVPKSRIAILRGHTSSKKLVEVRKQLVA